MAANAELTWGKCTITYKVGTKSYTATPKQGSTKLNVSEGNAVEAKIEGGETIAVRRDNDSYTLEWTEYIHPANVADYQDRIDNPSATATALEVTSANKDALSIKVPTVSLHSGFAFDSEGGITMNSKATFVKSAASLFTLAKASTAA